ncbi:hypothetical protein NDU88_001598 [Pleurodeles waltl]|uniref:Secreted protein n=1 Tax=Pleurodeles waltl TaxID=8319 RepID=A0AAV7SZY2_PLEWA|nr:hypothetical protein NDU88_001598 [Pleurodeles waltl]
MLARCRRWACAVGVMDLIRFMCIAAPGLGARAMLWYPVFPGQKDAGEWRGVSGKRELGILRRDALYGVL